MLHPILLLSLLFAAPVQFSNHRMLLLYADRADNAYLLQQKQLLDADANGLKERDIKVQVYLQHENPSAFKTKHISLPFTVILVGKDGGEKYRSNEVLPLKKLYAIIDAMPMRKQEMRKP